MATRTRRGCFCVAAYRGGEHYDAGPGGVGRNAPLAMAVLGHGSRAAVRVGVGDAPDVGNVGRVGIGMMVMMLVFWGLVIVGIVLAIRWLVTQGREPRATDSALDILRQRYARGGISKEEFDAKKKDLA
jgi:putative membrane protein